MNQVLTKDARGLVDGVVAYLLHDGKSKSIVPKVQALLTKVTSQTRAEKQALVESSVVLTPKERQSIQRLLLEIVGHGVTLDCRVNPHLLGGLRIQVGDWIVDTSWKTHLEQMAKAIV